MAELEPVSQPAGQPQHSGGRQANVRECPTCGGHIRVAEGKPFPRHNAYAVAVGGVVREGDTPCDGAGRIATRKHHGGAAQREE